MGRDPSAMTLVLHAGIHRTGTTSPQRALGAEPRGRRGIAYPGDGQNHQPLAWSFSAARAGGEEVLGLVEAAAPLARRGCPAPRTSRSTWTSAGCAVAARVESRVVFYLRRQDTWLMSWYNQHEWPFDGRSHGCSGGLPRHARGLPLARLRPAARPLEPGLSQSGSGSRCREGQVEDAPPTSSTGSRSPTTGSGRSRSGVN